MEFTEVAQKSLRTSDNLLRFSGRANRTELFWSGVLVYLGITASAIAVFIGFLATFVAGREIGTALTSVLFITAAMLWIVMSLQFLAVTVRRLHDVGRSGYWLLLGLTVLGLLVLAYWCLQPGAKGVNQHGAKPAEDVMEFTESVTRNLTGEGRLKFSGRASRAETLWFNLFAGLVNYALTITAAIFGLISTGLGDVLDVVTTIVYLALYLQFIALLVRRLHDVSKSGWWLLIAFTVVGVIPLCIWILRRGATEANQYGKQAP
jgi:uncharacterized membrane protein YhaH (DUF805 family)